MILGERYTSTGDHRPFFFPFGDRVFHTSMLRHCILLPVLY